MKTQANEVTEEKEKQRARGTGGLIRKRGSPFWYALWWQNGRQYCVSTKESSKMRAESKLQKMLGRKASDQQPLPEITKLRYENLRDSLVQHYRIQECRSLYLPADKDGKPRPPRVTATKHLDEFFRNWKIKAITPDAIRDYVISRQKAGASNGTINRSLTALKSMFRRAIREGKLQSAPHIEMLPEAPPRRGFIEVEDFRRLREHLPERLPPAVTLAYYSGMRLGEVRNLKWENADLKAGLIRLHTGETKSGKPRIIPLIGELPEMFRMLRKKTKSIYVFGDGAPLGSFRKAWASACVAAGLGEKQKLGNGTVVYSGLIFHDLRRSGIRNLIRSGVSQQVAMEISGHRTDAVFRRYNITSEADVKDAGRKATEFLAKPAPTGEEAARAKVDENMMKVSQVQ